MWEFEYSPYLAGIKAVFSGNVFAILGGILLALIAAVFVGQKLLRSSRIKKSRNFPEGDDPLGIIETRFAKGEITQDEYYRMKNTLSRWQTIFTPYFNHRENCA